MRDWCITDIRHLKLDWPYCCWLARLRSSHRWDDEFRRSIGSLLLSQSLTKPYWWVTSIFVPYTDGSSSYPSVPLSLHFSGILSLFLRYPCAPMLWANLPFNPRKVVGQYPMNPLYIGIISFIILLWGLAPILILKVSHNTHTNPTLIHMGS